MSYVLSPSNITILRSCPRRYYWENVEAKGGRTPDRASFSEQRATLFREAVAYAALKHAEENAQADDTQPVAVLSAAFLRAAVLHKASRLGCDSQPLIEALACARAVTPLDVSMVYSYLRHVQASIDGAAVHGQVDMLEAGDKGVRIVVWKTGSLAGSEAMAHAAQTLLLPLICELDGRRVESVEYRWPRAQLALNFRPTAETDAQARGLVRATIRELDARHQRNDWPATPGEACGSCAYRADCPALRERVIRNPYVMTDAELLAERAMVKAQREDDDAYQGVLDEEIRQRAGAAGVLEAGDYRARASVRRMAKLPPGSEKAAIKALMAAGYTEIDDFKHKTWEFPAPGAWKAWLDGLEPTSREQCKAAVDALREMVVTATLRVTRVGGLEEEDEIE